MTKFYLGLTHLNLHVSDPVDCTDTVPMYLVTTECPRTCSNLHQDSNLSPSPCPPTVISTTTPGSSLIIRTGSPGCLAFTVILPASSPPPNPPFLHYSQYLFFLATGAITVRSIVKKFKIFSVQDPVWHQFSVCHGQCVQWPWFSVQCPWRSSSIYSL